MHLQMHPRRCTQLRFTAVTNLLMEEACCIETTIADWRRSATGTYGNYNRIKIVKTNMLGIMNVLPSTIIFWVDSLNVICWIQGQSRDYKPFIANRVGKIHEYSSPDQWRYVYTKENLAHRGTRGTSGLELASDKLWWHGLQFLCHTEDKCPQRRSSNTSDSSQELKKASTSKRKWDS